MRPIAWPAILSNAPFGSKAVAKTTSTRKKVRIASIITPCPEWIPKPSAGAPRCSWLALSWPGAAAIVPKIHFSASGSARSSARELDDPVEDGHRGCDPAGDEEAQGHSRIEVPAGDSREGRDHDRNHEPVGKGAAHRVAVEGGAGPDEDQREGTDELGNPSAHEVDLHEQRIAHVSDGIAAGTPGRGEGLRTPAREPSGAKAAVAPGA